MTKYVKFLILLIFAFGIWFINSGFTQSGSSGDTSPIIVTILDSINIDSLFQTEYHLTGEEPFLIDNQLDTILTRHTYAPGIFKAQRYLLYRLEKYGYTTEQQPISTSSTSKGRLTENRTNLTKETFYEGQNPKISTFDTPNNVIAIKNGSTYPDNYYIICAHYDDTSEFPIIAPGADDNGSGTAAVIEAARVLKTYKFKYSIKFILFAGEEQGKIGSYTYASNAFINNEKIEGVLNLDMIGYDGNDDGIFDIHTGFDAVSNNIGSILADNVTNWNLSLTPQVLSGFSSSKLSDHDSFWFWNYPAVFISEDFFGSLDSNPFYHSTNDLVSTLNPSYYFNMASLAIGTLADLAQIDSVDSEITPTRKNPKQFVLYSPYPNPFNPIVNIEYDLPENEHIKISIYDILGHRIKPLTDRKKNAGQHHIIWEGTNSSGESAASGIYFVRLQTANRTEIKKITLIRDGEKME